MLEIQYILRMYKNGYSVSQIAEIAVKTIEEVQAVIEKEESMLIKN
jgi:transposase-like protein